MGLNGSPSRYLCPLLINLFCKTHPKLTLEFSVASSEALLDQVVAGEIDFAILSNPETNEDLVMIPLVIEEVHMVRAANGVSAPNEQVSIADFADLQFTTTAYLRDRSASALRALFRAHGLDLLPPVIINSIPMTKEILLGGTGFYVGPPANYGPEIEAGTLVSLPVPNVHVTRLIAFRRDQVASDALIELERFLREQVSEMVAAGTWLFGYLPDSA